MITATVPSVTQKVVKIISEVKDIQPSRLRISSDLSKELNIDTVDLVSIIWELEKSFQIEIPDEVPLHTVGHFVEYVYSQTEQ